ncbi:hypothetical protein VVZ00_05790, partial [Brucella melitensis]|uniref:hypothetical protein n=1 Tax=Brucella melitensis TaxID=29459 RepID=UPI002F355D6E
MFQPQRTITSATRFKMIYGESGHKKPEEASGESIGHTCLHAYLFDILETIEWPGDSGTRRNKL